MIDADKPVVSWEWYGPNSVFSRLVDRLPLDDDAREDAIDEASCGEPEAGITTLLVAAEGEIPYDVYLELELNREKLKSFSPYFLGDYEEMLQRCTVAAPETGTG